MALVTAIYGSYDFFAIYLPHLQHTIHNKLRNREISTCCKSKAIRFICHTFATLLPHSY